MRRVAIVGGGAAGTLLALGLVRLSRRPITIFVVEPNEPPGRGRAYRAGPPEHVLNVPSSRMSARPDEPDDFALWLSARYPGLRSPGETFAPRGLWGDYLAQRLADARRQAVAGVVLEHVVDEVHDVAPGEGCLSLLRRRGGSLTVDRAVLATGFAPSRPPVATPAGAPWRWFDPLDPGAADGLDPLAPVFVAGSGLTMVDLLLTLGASGHRGPTRAVSTHGLLPRMAPGVHNPVEPAPVWALPRTARGLSAAVRRLASLLGPEGGPLAVDALRPVTENVWEELPKAERRRFVRHLLPFWNVFRHRMAPDAARAVAALQAAGRLSVTAGRIVAVAPSPAGATVRIRKRGSSDALELDAARLFDATGPRSALELPLVRALVRRGLATPDRLGLGLAADANGRLLPARGDIEPLLFGLGPVLRGSRWETTAIREIRDQTTRLAASWAGQLG